MTLDELKRSTENGCITDHETIRGILRTLADMPARDLFVKVQPDLNPCSDLLAAVSLEHMPAASTADVFVEIHLETTHALDHSHVSNTQFYTSNLKALSLLSQIPGLYLPAIRTRKEG